MAGRRFTRRQRLHREDRAVPVHGEGFQDVGRNAARRDGAGGPGEGKEPERAEEECRHRRRLVASELGNTPTICRKSYVHPVVVMKYLRSGTTIALPARAKASDSNGVGYAPERRRSFPFSMNIFQSGGRRRAMNKRTATYDYRPGLWAGQPGLRAGRWLRWDTVQGFYDSVRTPPVPARAYQTARAQPQADPPTAPGR